MIALLSALLLVAAQAPSLAPAQAAKSEALKPEQELALTCSAALATTAVRQSQGDEAALRYPALGERGREFFVRVSAKVMDETGMSRAAISERLTDIATQLKKPGKLDAVMPSCIDMLDASGL